MLYRVFSPEIQSSEMLGKPNFYEFWIVTHKIQGIQTSLGLTDYSKVVGTPCKYSRIFAKLLLEK